MSEEVCDYTGTTCADCPAVSCFYAPLDDDEEWDVEVCDFTGEQCFGDKLFCEECSILADKGEEEN